MKTAIVIPAYNEAATIRAIVVRAARVADLVIVVDDGSTDGTSTALAGSPARVVRHRVNAGKAASLWNGIQLALAEGADVVVTMDGDGQHCADDVPRLVLALIAHPTRLAIGARVRRTGPMPKLRRFANRFADFWISWAAGHRVLDSQSGQRAYPAAFLRGLDLPHGVGRAFTLDSELVIEAARRGFRTVAVPVDAVYGTAARASHFRPWRDTSRIVAMVAQRIVAARLNLRGLVNSVRYGAVVHDPTVGLDVRAAEFDASPGGAASAD